MENSTPYHRPIQRVGQGNNIDPKTVQSFGDEWQAFHQFSDADIVSLGTQYFDIVSPNMLNNTHTALDLGCGSGRFMKYLLPRVRHIVGIDPSDAIFAADALLGKTPKASLFQTDISRVPYPDGHFDFVYCIGVLHHIPDTQQALCDAVAKLKTGGWFLLYIYYNLDNRGVFYRAIFAAVNALRQLVCRLPKRAKHFVCDFLALVLYMPWVLCGRFLKLLRVPLRFRALLPLHFYENQSFYIIRNDALDRFGTPLEQRFSRQQIADMMQKAGLEELVFSENAPFWHAVGKKK